jgi:hypothetical protein
MLRCEPLEGREAPVSLQLVPLLGVDSHDSWPVFAGALSALAARLSAPLAAADATVYHPWGSERAVVPPDTWRVYVGPGSAFAEAAPLGYSASPPSRNPGGFIAVNLDAMRGYDAGTVARHELLHTIGVPHGTGLMSPTLPPGTAREVSDVTANAIAAVGWEVTPVSHIPGHSRVFGIGTTPNGWMMVPNEDVESIFPGYVRVPDGASFAYAPSYAVLSPL